MNNLTQFETFEGNEVRTIEIDGEKRMSAVDVCKALGYKNPRLDWAKLKDRNITELDEFSVVTKMVSTDGKSYDTTTLNIDGVIRVCMLAKTDKAIEFRDWATKVLRKEIEKVQEENIIPDDEIGRLKLIHDLAGKLIDEKQRAVYLENKIKQDEPKIEFANKISSTENLQTIKETAKALGIGPNILFAFLRDKKILLSGGSQQNVPYQRYIDRGWFKVITKVYDKNGEEERYTQTQVTGKGMESIFNLWNKYDDQNLLEWN